MCRQPCNILVISWLCIPHQPGYRSKILGKTIACTVRHNRIGKMQYGCVSLRMRFFPKILERWNEFYQGLRHCLTAKALGPRLVSDLPSSFSQVVNNLFQTCCNKLETSSANTTCWQLVNRLITTCLQTCNSLCIFTRVYNFHCWPEMLIEEDDTVGPDVITEQDEPIVERMETFSKDKVNSTNDVTNIHRRLVFLLRNFYLIFV